MNRLIPINAGDRRMPHRIAILPDLFGPDLFGADAGRDFFALN
jgi:hypothetical protein